ncbi:hypothetical protein [Ornithinimicrobium tianjinense]|uniref:Transcriptional regulator, AbiEi antitoxin, Type IV TA system n=1 Tax=Ornithinimicrobium tianjinense TaxID=1195761 RepID=A0A917F2L2_9MICO|nr:hypothetical protein [Ornithinimicrobium tianjinense]GGF44517.1 hypothetical protein GCM10011366_10310 [Ornithinimicrobium tianjinense]
MGGVRTRKQALEECSAKAYREHLARGRWQSVFPGVVVTHSGTISWRERLAAALLAAGDGAVASGECALRLWGLATREPSILTVAIPASRKSVKSLPGVRIRRRRRLTGATRKGIAVTGLHQTVIDVLALSAWTLDDAVSLLARACEPRRSSPAALRAELSHHPRHPRRAILSTLLEAAELGMESGAEWRYVESVERAHGLPPMTPQRPLDPPHDGASGARPAGSAQGPASDEAQPARPPTPRRRRRLDFLDEERDVAVEIDGELFHRATFRQDRARDRRSAGWGRVVLRACWVDVVVTPCELAADVAVVLRARGWRGMPVPCSPTCPVGSDPRLHPQAA